MAAVNQSGLWRWRFPILAVCLIVAIWYFSHNYFPINLKDLDYKEQDVSLSTYSAPFICDIASLPPRARLVRRVREPRYVLLGHGFDDLVSDIHWNGEGKEGWEERLAETMLNYMKVINGLDPARDGFLDLGANIGTHTLYFAARGYNVHAFEPTHANHVLAKCSLAFSGIGGKVRFNAFGLGDKATTVCMTSLSDNLGDSRVSNDAGACAASQRAHVGTLDHYYRSFSKGQRIAILKVDIQGYELPALQHGTELFDSKDAPVAVFFELEPIRMRDQGYEPGDLLGNATYIERVPVTLVEADLEVFGKGEGYFDVVAVKNSWNKDFAAAGYTFVQ